MTASWMCPHCGQRPVTELGATSCEECAKPVETSADDRHVEAIVSAKMLLQKSIEHSGPPELRMVYALQGLLTVQIELLESQPDAEGFDFNFMQPPPEPPMGPQPWGQ